MRIRDYYLGSSGRVDSLFYHDEDIYLMAIQPDLPENTRQAREIEAHGYYIRPPRTHRRFCTWPDSLDSIDPVSVRAQKRCVEKMKPEWVERVKQEWEIYHDEVSVIFWSELPAETVRAILEILEARGELLE